MLLKTIRIATIAALALVPDISVAQFTPPPAPPALTITVLGWSDYIAPQVMEDYSRQTGVRVIYDVFESEAAFEARLAEAKGFYDLVTPPARLLPKLIAAGQLQKLDRAVVPGARDLWPEIAAKLAALDPGNQYALAHMWFGYGLAYDRKKAAERLPEAQMASWDVLFKPETLKKFTNCGVRLPDDADLVLQVSLLALKQPGELRTPADVRRAADAAGRLRPNITEFLSGGAAALADGEICLALMPASEAAQARDQARTSQPPRDIGFVVPREGAPLSLDALAMLKDAPHPVESARFAAFLQHPEVAARNSAGTRFAGGVLAARQLLGDGMRADRFFWPEDEVLRRLIALPAPDPALRKLIEREWLKVKTGSYEVAPLEPAGKKGKAGKKDDKALARPGQKAAPEPVAPVKKPRRPGEKPTG